MWREVQGPCCADGCAVTSLGVTWSKGGSSKHCSAAENGKRYDLSKCTGPETTTTTTVRSLAAAFKPCFGETYCFSVLFNIGFRYLALVSP